MERLVVFFVNTGRGIASKSSLSFGLGSWSRTRKLVRWLVDS